ncbi:MAG TPA: xanthine phosphoribosyltransferase [Kouleothrix sp.]|uniref:xanthine phosphoribosyltransferase n=1 Tax=Kouleothrix sp. TaxID=2779161 RepID=UPI002CAB8C5C|nr:xanthine phosphoribosyltransferase [Kouleothrix sp.]
MTSHPPIAIDTPFEPLVQRIVAEATVVDDRILKIDHFLNHRIEPAFMQAMGDALAERVRPFAPTLVLTAEASGIAPALAVAVALDVPLVYAKKYAPVVETPAISRIVHSPTKGGETKLAVSGRYLGAGMRVVLIDDFLANGKTALALAEIVADAGATTVAAGFLVEKLFQHGREALAQLGIPIATLAQVERLEGGRVVMRERSR